MKKLFKPLLIVAITVFAISCKDEDKTEPKPTASNLIKIGETYISGANAKATVYAEKALETGYNELFVALTDSTDGSPLTKGHLHINPMMDMGMMKHSTPIENTGDSTPTNGYYKVPVVFIMAGTSSQWSLGISFHNHKNDMEGEGNLGIEVINSSPTKITNTTIALDSSAKVFISLITPKKPVVGMNDFEIVLHKKVSMMDFPAIENYTIEIVPEMPSMGHGSPNNVNPIPFANGHYVGKVNFTMTGLWRVKLKLYKNGTLISDDQFFEITLH